MTDVRTPKHAAPGPPARARTSALPPAQVRETRVAGPVPRYEIPGWRERFGVIAGITGRGEAPGSSDGKGTEAVAAGFDLGLWTSEPVGDVMRRWRSFRHAEPGFSAHIMAHQVHGGEVAWHDAARGWTILEGVDGHLTARAGTLLLVTVADCIPIYLVAPRQRGVALLHAGWRGTAAGILGRGVAELTGRLGCAPEEIALHCGVGICGACYEVGAEVMSGCGVPHEGVGPWRLDLRERLADEGSRLGIRDISVSTWCSAHDRPAFYSHRASQGADGRMVAYLGFPVLADAG
ncbi:MAG TPA: polyphenol oxidase family protein [Gemmatimonadales bacterium]|nr:polyphenol oxidase family protein [Gemmatimonadales bacterium]